MSTTATFDHITTNVSTAIAGILFIAIVYGICKSRAKYTRRPLLNKSEQILFGQIQRILRTQGNHFSLHPQVSYGEFLSSPSKAAFWKINARRADMIICDRDFMVVAVIEYQGSGHWGQTKRDKARARGSDGLKRRSLRSSRIPLIEVFSKYRVKDLEERVLLACEAHRH